MLQAAATLQRLQALQAAAMLQRLQALQARFFAITLAPTEPAAALVRSLVAFGRVGPIAPGASVTVTFALSPDMVKVADVRGVRTLWPGEYTFVASSGLVELALPFTCDSKACRASVGAAAETAPPQLVEAA